MRVPIGSRWRVKPDAEVDRSGGRVCTVVRRLLGGRVVYRYEGSSMENRARESWFVGRMEPARQAAADGK